MKTSNTVRTSYIAAALMAVCLAFAQAETYAQYPQVPVTISKEKVRMDGRIYYSHIVLEKQTLYSISKAYGVSIQSIYDANPTLKSEGLKKNAIILIPASDGQAYPAIAATDGTSGQVQETTRTEETGQDSTGDNDRKKRQKDRKKKAKDDNFVTHTVKWYEDLDVISEKYGVPVDIIMYENGLTGRKLTSRQKLRIPADLNAYMAAHPERFASEVAAYEAPAETAIAEAADNAEADASVEKAVNAVLMLPFNAVDGKGSEGNMDFYSGALLAARDLGYKGINTDLSVYDTGNGSLPVTRERLAASDVVIGPVSAGDLRRLLEMTPAGTEVVSPVDPRTEYLARSHSNFIQAPTSSAEQYTDLIRWIAEEKKPEEKALVIYEKSLRGQNESASVDSLLRESGIIYSSFSYNILEGRDVLEPMESMMDSTAVNRVLVVSESEAFVNDVVRNLNLMIHDRYKVVMYGSSRLKGFETIDVEDYHNASLHLSMSYYVDYERPEVRDFLLKYRALYNTEPGAFAFQGYDVMYYFISVCAEYGKDWAEKISENEKTRMLQTDFRFRRDGDGGLKNTAIRRIVYGPDYSIDFLE